MREMLKVWNVDGDPLGESVGDGLRTLHSALYRLTALGDARGWVDKSGKPKPMLESTLSVIDRLLNNLTKLLDRVAELRSQAAQPAGDVKYVCVFSDGTEIGADHPQNSAAQHAPAPEAPEAAQEPVLSEKGEAVERSLARKLRRHQAARSACDGLLVPEAPGAKESRRDDDETARRQAQHLWENGWVGGSIL